MRCGGARSIPPEPRRGKGLMGQLAISSKSGLAPPTDSSDLVAPAEPSLKTARGAVAAAKGALHSAGSGRIGRREAPAGSAGPDQVAGAVLGLDQGGVDRGREARIVELDRGIGPALLLVNVTAAT